MDSYCVFNLYFPNDQWYQASFHMHVFFSEGCLFKSFDHS